MTEIVGYARVSSTGQDLTTQLEKLRRWLQAREHFQGEALRH